MANTGTNTTNTPLRHFLDALLSLGTSLWNGLLAIGERNAEARMLASLYQMSDDELAARGMKREDIIYRVHHYI